MSATHVIELAGETLFRWFAVALTIAAVLLAAAGCGESVEVEPRPVTFGTERTLLLKVPRRGLARGSAEAPPQPLVATSSDALETRRIVLRIFSGDSESTGLYRQVEVSVPPFAGTLVLKGVRPGKKRVSIEALTAAGGRLFTGGQVVDFTPGSTRYVEFLLRQATPPAAIDFRGGTIATDTRLVLSQSPYTITTPIVVTAGATLTVEPGVELRFETATGPAGADLIVRGRAVIGGADRVTALVRSRGVSAGARIRFEATMGNSVTNTLVTSTAGAAFELASASATITSCTVSGAARAFSVQDSVATLVRNRVTGGRQGAVLARSAALVDGNRFTDTTTAIVAVDTSAMVLSNVIQAATGLVSSGIRLERCTATVAQNRVTGTTAVFSPVTGAIVTGLDAGIEIVDSLSGTSATSQPMLVENNTVERAATAGIAIQGSDPLVRRNRIAFGRGRRPAGAQGITINRVQAFFPKQPVLVANSIEGGDGPAVGFLLDPAQAPTGGGILGSAAGGGNFIRANNLVNLGYEPGTDLLTDLAVDGFFSTQTMQVFGVDAILAASSAEPVGAGAPASVR